MPKTREGGLPHGVFVFDAWCIAPASVCHSWYQAHTALADGIFLALVGLAALSWAVTFLRWAAETVGYVLADRLAGAALASRVRQARTERRSMVDTQGL